MSHMLTYPGFSVVFIQTFSVHHTKEFILPEEAHAQVDTAFQDYDPVREVYIEKADALRTPIAHIEKDIENQIFTKGDVRRFSLRGFNFTMPIVPAEDESIYPVTLKGHCNVEMNLFFGHTVSITYRFLFDGHACTLSRSVTTDHIIAFLSNWLSAEFWSKEEGSDKTAIDYKTHFAVDAIWLSADGHPLREPEAIANLGSGRNFDAVALRYKNFIYQHCSQFKEDTPLAERKRLQRRWQPGSFTVDNDLHYAMVDVWENLQHWEEDGTDLFDNNRPDRMTEAEIIAHIREEHKGIRRNGRTGTRLPMTRCAARTSPSTRMIWYWPAAACAWSLAPMAAAAPARKA